MGTLSGGGKEVIRVGERCLVGANAGLRHLARRRLRGRGRPIRHRRHALTLPDGSVVKARELSGQDDLLLRRNSQRGAVEALARSGDWGGLNAALHANDVSGRPPRHADRPRTCQPAPAERPPQYSDERASSVRLSASSGDSSPA